MDDLQKRKLFNNKEVLARAEKDFCQLEEHQLEIHKRALLDGRLHQQISSMEGRCLELLLKAHRPKKTLEIGSYLGMSASWILRALNPGAQLFCLERNAEYLSQAKEILLPVAEQKTIDLKFFEVEALEFLQQDLKDEFFDAIFVDANKTQYPQYLEWSIAHLNTGALLLVDDLFLVEAEHLGEKQKKALRQSWQLLLSHPEVDANILPTGHGLAMALKK